MARPLHNSCAAWLRKVAPFQIHNSMHLFHHLCPFPVLSGAILFQCRNCLATSVYLLPYTFYSACLQGFIMLSHKVKPQHGVTGEGSVFVKATTPLEEVERKQQHTEAEIQLNAVALAAIVAQRLINSLDRFYRQFSRYRDCQDCPRLVFR